MVKGGRRNRNQVKLPLPSEPPPREAAVDAGRATLGGGPSIEVNNEPMGALAPMGVAVSHGIVGEGNVNPGMIASSDMNALDAITQDEAKQNECQSGQNVTRVQHVQSESTQHAHAIVKGFLPRPIASSQTVLPPNSSQLVKPTLVSGTTWKGRVDNVGHGSRGGEPQATVPSRAVMQPTLSRSVQSVGSAAKQSAFGATSAVAKPPQTRGDVSTVASAPTVSAPLILPTTPPTPRTPQKRGHVPTPMVAQDATKKPCTPATTGAAQSTHPSQAGLPAATPHVPKPPVAIVRNPQSASTRLEVNRANSGSAATTQGSAPGIKPVAKPQSAPRQVVTSAGPQNHGTASAPDEVDVDAQLAMARSILPRPTPPVGPSTHALQTILPARSQGGMQSALPSASASRATQVVRAPATTGAVAGRVGRAATQPVTSTPIVRSAERSLARVNPHANPLSVTKSIYKTSPMTGRTAASGAGVRNRQGAPGFRNLAATAPLVTSATRIPAKNGSYGPAPSSAAATVRQVAPLDKNVNALFDNMHAAHTVQRQNVAPVHKAKAAMHAKNGAAITRQPPLATVVQNAVVAGNVQPYPAVNKGAPVKYSAPVASRGVTAQSNVRQSTQHNNGAVVSSSQRAAPVPQRIVPAVSTANSLAHSGGAMQRAAARPSSTHVAGVPGAAAAPGVSQAVPGMRGIAKRVQSVVGAQARGRFVRQATARQSQPVRVQQRQPAAALRNVQQTRAALQHNLVPHTRPGEQALVIGPADLPGIEVMRELIPAEVWEVPLLPATLTQEHRISSILFNEQFVAAEKAVDRLIRNRF